MSAVVTPREIGAARELQRVDRLAAVTVEANLTPALPLGNALDQLDEIARSELPATAQVGYLGESLNLRETGNTVFVILALVLVLVTLWAFGLTLNV